MEHYRVVEAKRGDAGGSVNGQSLNYAYLLQEEGYRSTGASAEHSGWAENAVTQ